MTSVGQIQRRQLVLSTRFSLGSKLVEDEGGPHRTTRKSQLFHALLGKQLFLVHGSSDLASFVHICFAGLVYVMFVVECQLVFLGWLMLRFGCSAYWSLVFT